MLIKNKKIGLIFFLLFFGNIVFAGDPNIIICSKYINIIENNIKKIKKVLCINNKSYLLYNEINSKGTTGYTIPLNNSCLCIKGKLQFVYKRSFKGNIIIN